MVFLNALDDVCNFLQTSVEELPINIYTADFTFVLCFYFNETADSLTVFVTDEEGMEKLVCISKSEIVYWEVVYAQDIKQMTSDDPEKYNKVNSHE